MAFRDVLEEIADLDELAAQAGGDPYVLALEIRERFERAFRSPFARNLMAHGIRHVNFRQIAERLLEMLARQRKKKSSRPPGCAD